MHQFLSSTESCEQFITSLRRNKELYGGLNVLLYDGHELHHYNNIIDEHTVVQPGVHSVSNATLNTPWPKVQLAKTALSEALHNEQLATHQLITLLANSEIAPDDQLPDTGVGIHLERALSAQFVKLPNYGTRCSTAITFHKNGTIHFLERTFEQGEMQFDKPFVIEVDELI